MAVKIRLRRMGRKKQAHYRVVVADSQSPRDGRFVETLGYYKPLSHPARIVLNMERVEYWLAEGAEPSDTVRSLINKARKGGDAKVAVGEVDLEERKAKRAEELAARRAAEAKASAETAEAEAPSEEPAAEAEAEAAPEEAEAEEPAAEAEEAPASEVGEAPAAEAEEAPAAEAEEAPAAEAEETPAAEAEEVPAAEAEEATADEGADEEKSE